MPVRGGAIGRTGVACSQGLRKGEGLTKPGLILCGFPLTLLP